MRSAGPLFVAIAIGVARAAEGRLPASSASMVAPGLACSSMDRPIVAEVFYDATGDDTGREFVELLNPAEAPRSLAGLRLESGDGASPGRWTLRWTGSAIHSWTTR